MSVDDATFATDGHVTISGDWSPGKTTLLRALTCLPLHPWTRVVKVEAAPASAGGSTRSTPEAVG